MISIFTTLTVRILKSTKETLKFIRWERRYFWTGLLNLCIGEIKDDKALATYPMANFKQI